tara:strand:+ start:3865 stop:4662 length:798 start_codon:yes stop_codon:yes gene_type:complete
MTENDAILEVTNIVGEDREQTFRTNGRKLTPRWSNFALTRDANKADQTYRPITSKLFSPDLPVDYVKKFHLIILNALSQGLDQAARQGELRREWHIQFSHGGYFPDLSDKINCINNIRLNELHDYHWIAMFGQCNPAVLWGDLPWPDEFIYSFEAAIVLGSLICKDSAIVSPDQAYAICKTYYQEAGENVTQDDINFIFAPLKRLIDNLIDIQNFNALAAKHLPKGECFTLYSPEFKRKPLMARLKEKAAEIADMAPSARPSSNK